ncbi:response regulator transcription factor [Croceicoccus gelatinilyticus]|uniref:response regulator transcription factor n=1 Tax=Croceicoccus gelatinilyticus TaxID=2835536 RepID=UPI001BCDE7F7|nr:response regulator [Croceicoccus gelatinilyticus]
MGRIILAEDDPILGEIVKDRLFDAGHAVGWLCDGEAALAAMHFRAPHLAILDQRMPKKSGIEVLQEMRLDPDLSMVPVMMLTLVNGEQDQRIAFYEGADEYVTKPADLERLVFLAEDLIGRRITRISGLDSFKLVA